MEMEKQKSKGIPEWAVIIAIIGLVTIMIIHDKKYPPTPERVGKYQTYQVYYGE